MTSIDTASRTGDALIDELTDWLEQNWDPDLTVGEWWERLGMSGWAAPMLPEDSYGKGLTRGDALRVASTIHRFGALGAPAGMAVSMAAPTIVTHATREQIDRLIPPAVTGKVSYCQLFSEPGAGSDLAGLTCKGEQDGEEWRINGQKVWTSGGQYADVGMLLARTDPHAPKHRGITWFVIDMDQPGVELRPLREMTGNAMFNEVFLTDAIVPDENRIGAVNDGWAAANTTLLHERSGMGARSGGGEARAVIAGGVADNLGKRAGDFAPKPRSTAAPAPEKKQQQPTSAATVESSPAKLYIELARELGKSDEPAIRQRLAQAHIIGSISRFTTERHKAVRARGGDIAGVANFSKLLMADIVRLNRDLGMELLGARGMLHSYDGEELPGGPKAVAVTSQALGAQALPIYGGTDQIQRNLVGERALGLPKEPGDLSKLPFSELPKNT